MSDLVDKMAEALWLADNPWRQLSVFGPSVPVAWADADDLDRDLYRQKAKTVIDHLRLTEETGSTIDGQPVSIRFVSKWWEAS
jgi:hypothetical protein